MDLNKKCVYLEETKYLNYLLRSICIITRIPSNKKSNLKHYLLLEWIYTVVFCIFLCLVFYDLIYIRNILKPHVDNPTMDSINYVLVTILAVGIILLSPLLACRAHKNREEYFELWRDYQFQYEQYTVSELNLNSTKFVIFLTIGGIIITVLELLTNCFLTSQTTPTYVYAYWLIYLYANLTTVSWAMDCHMLTKASEKLLEKFLAFMKQKNKVASETHVIGYIELWRKLSDMTSELMETGHGSYELNFTVHSVIVIQSLYGIAALYIDHQRLAHYNIYIASAAWSIINLVIFCEAAYSVTTQIGFKTKEAIQSLSCNEYSSLIQEQIFMVLKTIQSDIPKITVGGYFIMDRSYIISYLGVAVSYIIVLVQFKIGTS